MSLKLDSKTHLLAEDYVYSIILINKDGEHNLIQDTIFSIIKGFLNLFSIKKIKSQTVGLVINGEFRPNGVVVYWLKGKCKTIVLDSIPLYQIETIINHCEEANIPVYKNIDFKTKVLKSACLGPYWTDRLAKVHPVIKDEILKRIK
jgi:hypothetical protein